jgi:hypothetical protein
MIDSQVRDLMSAFGLSKMPSSRSWMINSVPGFHRWDALSDFGRTTCPFVDNLLPGSS